MCMYICVYYNQKEYCTAIIPLKMGKKTYPNIMYEKFYITLELQ